MSSNPPRRAPQSGAQEYTAVPQAPYGMPAASASTLAPAGPRGPAPPGQRTSITHGVASGAIGGGYGPYSYQPTQNRDGGVYSNSRFSTAPSDVSSSTGEKVGGAATAATTATVPQYLWDKDPELDDALHNPDPVRDAKLDRSFTLFSARGWLNASALIILVAGLLTLFAGYPIIIEVTKAQVKTSGFNLGGINSTGQVPDLPGMRALIDKDTPDSVYSRTGSDGQTYNLVFSDEFEVEGRTFYPGDDPYWEAVDFNYWPTVDIEWYDPKAATTRDGKLVLTMTEQRLHNLNWVSGMLQSWNKVCFTTGYLEVSVSLPGNVNAPGFWPGVWTMGNLGRAGYGASTEGMWPYSYAACDVGTFPNQTRPDGTPEAATTGAKDGGPLSFLPGQRLSACTCPGSDHPGPDVTVGRSAPEIDLLEAQIDTDVWTGQVSQSFQVAPFNYQWKFNNASPATTIYDDSLTKFNTYTGAEFQQAASALTYVPDTGYRDTGDDSFVMYGMEWWSDPKNRGDGHIAWYSDDKLSWKILADATGPDDTVEISERIIPEEPMYMVLNFGMSPGFQPQDFSRLEFPNEMRIEYVRMYQREGLNEAATCNPSHHPTKKYIEDHPEAYTNANWTTWGKAGYTFPRNSLYDGC